MVPVGGGGGARVSEELAVIPPGHPQLWGNQGTHVWGGLMGCPALG